MMQPCEKSSSETQLWLTESLMAQLPLVTVYIATHLYLMAVVSVMNGAGKTGCSSKRVSDETVVKSNPFHCSPSIP